jgi:hypothetical protein
LGRGGAQTVRRALGLHEALFLCYFFYGKCNNTGMGHGTANSQWKAKTASRTRQEGPDRFRSPVANG